MKRVSRKWHSFFMISGCCCYLLKGCFRSTPLHFKHGMFDLRTRTFHVLTRIPGFRTGTLHLRSTPSPLQTRNIEAPNRNATPPNRSVAPFCPKFPVRKWIVGGWKYPGGILNLVVPSFTLTCQGFNLKRRVPIYNQLFLPSKIRQLQLCNTLFNPSSSCFYPPK